MLHKRGGLRWSHGYKVARDNPFGKRAGAFYFDIPSSHDCADEHHFSANKARGQDQYRLGSWKQLKKTDGPFGAFNYVIFGVCDGLRYAGRARSQRSHFSFF
jgi:hypothetical protein